MFPSSYYPEVTTTLPPKNPNTPAAGPVNTLCPKCGTAKSGQSCCGRGGSWFKKCGDSGDDNFEHTWFEGITACKTKSKRVCIAVDIHKHRLPCTCMFNALVSLFILSRSNHHVAAEKPQHTGCRSGEHLVSQMRHQEVRSIQLLRSWRFLVREVRRFRRR